MTSKLLSIFYLVLKLANGRLLPLLWWLGFIISCLLMLFEQFRDVFICFVVKIVYEHSVIGLCCTSMFDFSI